MPPKTLKRGSALISALFIMTLVAIAATAMSTRLQLDIYRTRLTISSDQLYLASQVVNFWAMDTIKKQKKGFPMNEEQDKVKEFPATLKHLYPDIIIEGSLYDLQARFNLNNLQENRFHSLFFKLLEHTLTNKNNEQHRELLQAIVHWISPYQPGRGHDNLVGFYLKQAPPYLPGYQPMKSISELRLVNGVSHETYQKLLPNVTVLPEVTPININTASKLLLMSLGHGLSEQEVEELLQMRSQKGFKDLDSMYKLLQKLNIPIDQITTKSSYYLSVATVTSQDFNLTTYTILKQNKDQVGIVSESLNTM